MASTITSGPGLPSTVTTTTSAWLLSDPTVGDTVVGGVLGTPKISRPANAQQVHVLGRRNDVVVTDVMSGRTLDVVFQTLNTTDRDALTSMLARGNALWLRSTPYPSTLVRVVGTVETEAQPVGVNVIYRTTVQLTQVDS